MDGLISVNGVINSEEQATIPACDRGFLFADSVYETCVAFQGKVLDLAAHLERLRESAAQLNLSFPWSDAELAFELESLAERLAAPKASLRLVVTRGPGLGLALPKNPKPNRVIFAYPVTAPARPASSQGVRLQLCELGATQRGPSAKTGNYLASVLALNKAQTSGYDDILWVNGEGEITEASTANIFFIGRMGEQVELATPSLYSGLLRGITRTTLLELLLTAGIPAREEVISRDELARFDEAFLCSTVKGLIPVAAIGQQRLHTMRENSAFKQIFKLFSAHIAQQLGHRVDWDSGKRL